MKENTRLTREIVRVVQEIRPANSEVSCTLMDLGGAEPMIAGYEMDKFIYPASIYKVFIGAEVLRQVEEGRIMLDDVVEVVSPNDVDKPVWFSETRTHNDQRPLLGAGDRVTVDYLLDLMLTRSDNSASNVLIDLVGRESINENIILPNDWRGSEVTRKYLARSKEDPVYVSAPSTMSSAKHLVEFFWKVETGRLVNSRVSAKLRDYMLGWNRNGGWGFRLPQSVVHYRKGGWLEVNRYKDDFWSAVRRVREGKHAIVRYSGDVGVIRGINSYYVYVLLTITKTKWPWVKFPMKRFLENMHSLMESR